MAEYEKPHSRFENRKTISLTHFDLTNAILKDRIKSSCEYPSESKMIEAILLGKEPPLVPLGRKQVGGPTTLAFQIVNECYEKDDAVTKMFRHGFHMLAALPITDNEQAKKRELIIAVQTQIPLAKMLPLKEIELYWQKGLSTTLAHWLDLMEDYAKDNGIPKEWKEDPCTIERGRALLRGVEHSPESLDYQLLVQFVIENMVHERNCPTGFHLLSILMHYFVFPNTPEARSIVLSALNIDLGQ